MNSKTYAKYSWNQNDYINVMVYSFKNTDHTSVTLGISNIPYKVAGYPDIEGLTNSKNYPLNKPGSFPYCVSLNAIYVDKSMKEPDIQPININRIISIIQPTQMPHWLTN